KPLWRAVWQWPGPQCTRTFLWLLTENILLTNVERKRRHLTANGLCEMCGQTEETILQAVRDCSLAVEFGYGLQNVRTVTKGLLTIWLPSLRMDRWGITSYMIHQMGFVSGSTMNFLA
ncbi:ribonuclease H-like superfamily protein, partial [Striga asiatica]